MKKLNKIGLLSGSIITILLMVGVQSVAGAQTKPNSDQLPPVVAAPTAPPAGFNPLTASGSDLEKYGFPQRPTDPNALASWTKAMESAKHYVAPVQIPSTFAHGDYTNWAGYEVDGSNNNNDTFYYTSSNWVQPAYSGTSDPSFWVGQGGINGEPLTQAGADSNASSVGGSTQYEFWVEDWPLNTVWEASPVLYKNDEVYVNVTYKGSTSTAFLDNESTGYYTSVNFSTPYYWGGSADYINEAVNSTYNNWSSWNSTTFTSGTLEWDNTNGTNGGGEFTAYNYTKDIMENNNVVYSTPGAASNGDFTITASN